MNEMLEISNKYFPSKFDLYTVKNRCFTEPPKKVPEISKSIQRGPQSQKNG
jgi:hypothetical protein